MNNLLYTISLFSVVLLFLSCKKQQEKTDTNQSFSGREGEIELVVLDPGHFHASLLLKFPQDQVNDTVRIYAPEGNELEQYLASIEGYNHRPDNPTDWQVVVKSGADFLENMLEERKGNVVLLAGNNANKTRYIARSVEEGYHLLSDKPMAISREGFQLLEQAYSSAAAEDLLLYDVMTERYEVINALARALIMNTKVMGELQKGSAENPAIRMENLHHYYKKVSGNVLVRPAWFYDVDQQGEAIVDVATHLVDLLLWQCFPDETVDYRTEVKVTAAEHWPTLLTLPQFTLSTGLDAFPPFLMKDVRNDTLEVYGNGRIHCQIRDLHAELTARWDYQAPPGGGDSYAARIRGTKATLEIVQDESVGYVKQLYLVKQPMTDRHQFESELKKAIEIIQQTTPSITFRHVEPDRYQVVVPDTVRKGHEDYFGMVADRFFSYLVDRNMPEWEIPNILTKYYITTTALGMAQ